MAQHLREKTTPFVFKGLFIWAKVIPINEKTIRLAKHFCSVHMEKRHPGCDVALNINWIEKLLTRQKVIPLNGKVVFIWEKHYPGHRDLACQQARSRYTGKLFVSYERSVTFHIIFIPRRNNFWQFCPYEQALKVLFWYWIGFPPSIFGSYNTLLCSNKYKYIILFLSGIFVL
jgi:hypothetical protein